jgi:hypothetical protein
MRLRPLLGDRACNQEVSESSVNDHRLKADGLAFAKRIC